MQPTNRIHLNGNGRANWHTNGKVHTAPTDRLPPQNLEAELGVLGAILLDNAAMHDVAPLLSASDFYRADHQIVYQVMRDLHAKSQPIDALILSEELGRRGQFDEIGGDETLFKIVGSVPHAANAKYHAQIVREKAITRNLAHALTSHTADCYSNQYSASELLERALSAVLSINTGHSGAAAIPIGEAIDRTLERIRARSQGTKFGAETGFGELDDLIGGCLPNSTLTLIGARPSMGKTAFGVNICEHAAAKTGLPTLFISIEMGELEVTERMLADESRIGGTILKKPWSNEMDWRALTEAANRLRGTPFYLVDEGGMTLAKIAAVARREKARHGIGLVMIDYAQLIAGTGDDDSQRSSQEIGARISRGLKDLARDLRIPVVVLSQLNRNSEHRADHRPLMMDIRETGAWEQDADLILFIHRPEYYKAAESPGLAEIIVGKNRNGRTATVEMTFLRERTRFVDGAPVNLGPAPAANGQPF